MLELSPEVLMNCPFLWEGEASESNVEPEQGSEPVNGARTLDLWLSFTV